MATVKVSVKFRLGMTEYNGYEVANEIERDVPEGADPLEYAEKLTMAVEEQLKKFAKPRLPYVKLTWASPDRLPLPQVTKLYQGHPVLEDGPEVKQEKLEE